MDQRRNKNKIKINNVKNKQKFKKGIMGCSKMY